MQRLFKTLSMLAFALVFMAGTAFGQNNSSTIDQVGNGHAAMITQTGDQNSSELAQDIGKGPAQSNYDGHATVTQTGDRNTSKLTQNTFYGGHDATITQVGNDNYSEIVTSNGGGSADVTMNGDENELLSYRLDKDFSYHTQKNDNQFTLGITGNSNTVGMNQEFGDGTVDITGDRNDVLLRQHGGGANFNQALYDQATITVDGSDNTIDVNQDGGDGARGLNNTATVELLNASSFNTVEVDQAGDYHTSTITVDGMNNQAIVDQQQ